MAQQGPHPTAEPVTNPRLERNLTNLTPTSKLLGAVGIPANISVHDSSYVAISGGRSLSDVLMPYYAAGVRRVEIVIDVEGQRLAAEAKIYRRTDKQSGRVYLWLYPLQPAQRLLRDLLRRYRGDAAPNAKRHLPIAILAIIPKPK
jgi:hypothetical protein